MISIDADLCSPVESNIVEFAGHIYQGNTFRSRRLRIEGTPVLIGRIRNRYEILMRHGEE